jgi:DNA polymerase-1
MKLLGKASRKEAAALLTKGSASLSQVEANGIRIDLDYLTSTRKSLQAEIETRQARLKGDPLWARWKKRFGDKANLDSLDQIATLLYTDMKYPCKEYTKGGKPKADEEAFESIDLPFVKEYGKVRKLLKADGTYLAGIEREVCGEFLHPFFGLNTTRTYRSSSQWPNFQNMPIRNPLMGELIRRCFIPRKGRRLIEVDYSGIEVRIAYCYHKDPVMRKYLLDKSTDMHRDMAAQIYMLKEGQVTKAARHAAKNMFVFPQFYGSYYLECAKALWAEMDRREMGVKDTNDPDPKAITGLVKDHLAKKGIRKLGKCSMDASPVPGTFEHHVQQVEKDFWGRRFRTYDQWKRRWYSDYLNAGQFETYTGFLYAGPFRKNEVINYPVQGSAFHCLLWSLIEVQKELRRKKMRSLIVGQIHDSLLGDVPDSETEDFLKICKRVMTVDLPKVWTWLTIPLEIEADATPVDKSWFEKTTVAI